MKKKYLNIYTIALVCLVLSCKINNRTSKPTSVKETEITPKNERKALNLKSKRIKSSLEKAYFQLEIKKVSNMEFEVYIYVTDKNNKAFNLKNSGYCGIFLSMKNNEIVKKENWLNQDHQTQEFVNLENGIYKRTFTNVSFEEVNEIRATISLSGKKGTGVVIFDVAKLKQYQK